MTDRLIGLKENVIIGKLIPARARIELPPEPVKELPPPILAPEDEEGTEVALEAAGPAAAVAVLEGPEAEAEEAPLEGEPGEGEPPAEREDEIPGLASFPQSYVAEPDEPDQEE
jgi:hypothetical protein